MKPLGEQLKDLRESLGWSLAEVARQMGEGKYPSTIRNAEHAGLPGHEKISLKLIEDYAEIFGYELVLRKKEK